MKVKRYVVSPRSGTRNSKIFLLSVLFCLLSVVSFAQVLTLDSVLSRIENNNPALLKYQNKINAADELAKGARALPAPKAGIMLDENPYQFDFGTKMVNLSFSQSFPNTQQLNANENYLKSLSDITLKEQERLRNQLFAQAKINYFGRYVTEKRMDVLKENIGLMESMIVISEKELASGMGNLGSVYKMKARVEETKTMLINEEHMAKEMTFELNYLMAAEVNQNFLLDTNNLLKDYTDKNLLASIDLLELNRSDIQKMNSEINSMKLNQTLMSTMSKPEFELGAKHYFMTGQPDMFAVEAMVMIPIAPWSAKGYKSKVKAMGYDIEAMEQEKQAMLNMANQMVTMIAHELNTEYTAVENYRSKVIPAYQKSFDANLLSYSQNTGDLMKALLAWDDLLMAQMEYLKHLGNLLKAQANYEKEMQIR